MRARLVFIILTICVSMMYAEEKEVFHGVNKDTFKSVVFNDDGLISFYDAANTDKYDIWNQSFKYNLVKKEKFYTLELKISNFSKSLLALKSNYCLVLYDAETSNCCFLGMNIPTRQVESVFFPKSIEATSELKEKNITYSAKNLANVKSDSCWCEGVDDYGIGQSLKVRINAKKLVIITGYISVKKQYLFEANARPRKITIEFVDANTSAEYELLDTPNPQVIDFADNYHGTIKIIIDEVYPGTKYKDTCISSIICKYLE